MKNLLLFIALINVTVISANDIIYFSKSPNKGERTGELVVGIPQNRRVKELKIYSNNGEKLELEDKIFGKKIISEINNENKKIIVYQFYAYPKIKMSVTDPSSAPRMTQAIAKHKIQFNKTSKYIAEVILDNNEKHLTECSFSIPGPIYIGLMGDSYISGEGCPEKKYDGWNYDKLWDDINCHRSSKSGANKAIRDFIRDFESLDFIFENVSCSGATISDLISSRVEDEESRFPCTPAIGWVKRSYRVNSQIDQLKSLGRGIDILVTDGGGNDLQFGNLGEDRIKSSIFSMWIFDDGRVNRGALNNTSDEIMWLQDKYSKLNTEIKSKLNNPKIIFVNYPNPLIGGDGLCKPSSENNEWFDCWTGGDSRTPKEDWKILQDKVFLKLNSEIIEASSKFNWKLVDVSNRANGHGICECDQPYFNWGSSFNVLDAFRGPTHVACEEQGDPFGTLHPNYVGTMRIYYQPIYDAVEKAVNEIVDKESSLEIELRAKRIANAKENAKERAKKAVKEYAAKIKAEREKREAEHRKEEL